MQNFTLCILLVSVLSFSFCGHSQDKNKDSNVLRTRIDNYLTARESNGFNGSVLVAKNNHIILKKGFGYASKEKSIPMSPKTVLDIGSVTKQFTATAILKLTEEGKLKLTDSLPLYFKDIPQDKRKITIHQLLTHSAGFVDNIGKSDFDHIPEMEFFKQLFTTKLLFNPGEKHGYSNSGYSILGRIIEIASGKNYENYLNDKLFKPAGMTQTGYLLPKWDNGLIVDEYLHNVVNNGNQISKYQQDGKIAWPLKANGGIYSTQEDMYKWYLALKNHKVLSKASMEKLTTPYIAEYEDKLSHYAYGWAIFMSNRDTKIVTHNGSNGISFYEFIWLPKEDALILFATNSFIPEYSGMTFKLEKILFDKNLK